MAQLGMTPSAPRVSVQGHMQELPKHVEKNSQEKKAQQGTITIDKTLDSFKT